MLLLLLCIVASDPALPAASSSAIDPALSAIPFDRSVLFESAPAGTSAVDEDTEYKNMHRQFGLNFGFAAFANFNTEIAVSSGAVGTILDMEEVLGLNGSSNVARLDGFWSFGPRGSLNFSYFDIRRSGSRVVDQDIVWGDINIPAGSKVDSKFNTRIIKLDYRYNFVSEERTTIAASFGLHVMGIDTALDANALSVSESFKVTAPLPLIGLHWTYALSPNWKLTVETQVMQMDIGAYRGYTRDTRFSLDNDCFEHFGWASV